MAHPSPDDQRTDDWARDLLHDAAATIDVPPAPPLAPVTHWPRWPVVAAAVLTVALGAALLGRGGSTPEPAPTPISDHAATVPSVFGLTLDQAKARLEAAGLTVTERPQVVCEVDRQALGTVPVTGAATSADGSVFLSWADSTSIDCAGLSERAAAWDFLGFVAGTRPAPAFAADVSILLNSVADVAPVILDNGRAQDPAQWRGALSEILTAMSAPDATMSADRGAASSDNVCPTPAVGYGVMPLEITIGHYLDTASGGCGPRVILTRTRAGAISAVSLMPDVVVSFAVGQGRMPLATPTPEPLRLDPVDGELIPGDDARMPRRPR